MWRCRCDCGEECSVAGSQLTGGKTKSCGCLRRENMSARRKYALPIPGYEVEHRALLAAITRCHNKRNKDYRYYGARGIRVCDEWRFSDNGLELFLKEIGRRPSPDRSLDRINNDGNYEPGNVRWATVRQQTDNRRRAN